MRYFARTIWLCLCITIWTPPAQADQTTWQDVRPIIDAALPVRGSTQAITRLKTPVIIAFFASWCPPCSAEFTHLNALRKDHELGNIQIIAINLFEKFGGKEDPERMKRFLERTKPDFPLIKGTEEMRIALGNIERIPTVLVFGISGKPVWRFVHENGATKTHATEEDLRGALHLAIDG